MSNLCLGASCQVRRWVDGRRLTFFTFLFHSSFATCTFTVFFASPAETTIPLISLESTPEVDFVTVLDAAATAGATALADIAGCGPPMVIWPYRGISRSGAIWLFSRDDFDRERLRL